jgi:hypothetical protein
MGVEELLVGLEELLGGGEGELLLGGGEEALELAKKLFAAS